MFEALWQGYAAVAPQAARVHGLLERRGERFSNDHVAFRTFPWGGVGLDELAAPFRALGYTETGTYRFEHKRLVARSYSLAGQPRVFISELLPDALSEEATSIARALVEARPPRSGRALLVETPTWAPPRFADYAALAEESEYAAWVAAHGIRANHFTVSVNDLETFGPVEGRLSRLNAFLEDEGFALNGEGDKIQGGPEVLLAQSSTVAPRVRVDFADGPREVPGAYYEFALRYPDADGRLFDGFVTGSADKIFESTDAR